MIRTPQPTDAPRAGFDLDPESRRVLEWDTLLDWIATMARTTPGAAAVRALSPVSELHAIRFELAAVEEIRQIHADSGGLLPGGLPDPGPALSALKVAGLRLEAGSLRALALWLETASTLRRRHRRGAAAPLPPLQALARELPDLGRQARLLLGAIEPDGSLADRASAALRGIRRRRADVVGRLRRQLEGRLRDPESASVIRDDFVTQRNGRYVIPVRSDAPRPVRGIVHGSSSSGATQFIEPLESIELNNAIVQLDEDEREEEERLLRQWSEELRRQRTEIVAVVEALALVDCREARARFAERVSATEPGLEQDGVFVLEQGRHPLLERRLFEKGESPVPLSLTLAPAEGVLIISGPNAGGKTVALKTIGLLLLMAHAGIPVPAREMRLPLYRQLRADIGDHQSIDADLSTYSAHVRATAAFLRQRRARGLFLFDEIGTGTEPNEGAALAQAVLERLRGSGMTVVATTHLGPLKRWSMASDDVASAAMELDEGTLRPTFRLVQGGAGVSAGLPIAERLGLERELIARAEALLGRESLEGERYLARLRALQSQLEQERATLEARQASLEAEREQWRTRAERDEQQRRRDAGRVLERELQAFRRKAAQAIERIDDSADRRGAERRRVRAERDLAARQRRAAAAPQPTAASGPPPQIRPGMRVVVASLGREGQVESLSGERVAVRFGGGMVVRVERTDLRAVDAAAPSPTARRVSVSTSFSVDAAAAQELILIGKTVDEALAELDRFLDRAAVAGHGEVRVVHGHGTGRLRAAVRRFLDGHPLVGAHRAGASHEGGEAATIVSLA